jgi:hypothetical protein
MNELKRFLSDGEAPVYMGWESMVDISPQRMTCMAVRALKMTGYRGIILGGFAQLEKNHLVGQPDEKDLIEYADRNILFVQPIPQYYSVKTIILTKYSKHKKINEQNEEY